MDADSPSPGGSSDNADATETGSVTWDSGDTPRSRRFGDIYFSPASGLDEARYVFLDATGLPATWAGRSTFTIGETGFGTGLNFLAAWDLWRRTPGAPERLHFVSVEGFPLTPETLARAHRPWPELADLSRQIVRALPPPAPGCHRRHFEQGRVTLTLLHGPVEAMLEDAVFRADAWFLDGFSPARNPEMWTERVARLIHARSAPGARLATFTAAGWVRRNLATAGFTVERRPGHGTKRAMTIGERPAAAASVSSRSPAPTDRRALVIGSGVAGAAITHALSLRGWRARVIDRGQRAASGASGNFLGITKVRATLDDRPSSLLGLSACDYARHMINDVTASRPEDRPLADWCGALELAVSAREQYRQERLAQWTGASSHWHRTVDAGEASDLAGIRIDYPGRWYPTAGWIRPRELCGHLLSTSTDEPMIAAEVATLVHDPQAGTWRALDPNGDVVAQAPVAVIATGAALARVMGGLPSGAPVIRPALGRISDLAATSRSSALETIVTGDGYILPASDGRHACGATYREREADDPSWMDWTSPELSGARDEDMERADDDANRARILASLPTLANGDEALTILGGRTSVRATTPDRMPIAGPASGFRHPMEDPTPGLYVLGGLGSRGFTQAWLLAEWIASMITGEPWPLGRSAASTIDPARPVLRRP